MQTFQACHLCTSNVATNFATFLLHITHAHAIAGSHTVISLTFDDQSRTLTCTSTGGPAPNVTWRRDGVVITLNATRQQTKRLVDPGNGTYIRDSAHHQLIKSVGMTLWGHTSNYDTYLILQQPATHQE